jgi:aquaporin Z
MKPRAFHWPEYLMEALGLGLFMMSAGGFATLLWAEGSPVRAAVPSDLARRAVMGVAMGLTAVVNIYSPWGRRSGAHLNPATTLTFWRLGKVSGRDAVFYVAAQFAGGTIGVYYICALLGCDFL